MWAGYGWSGVAGLVAALLVIGLLAAFRLQRLDSAHG